LEDEETALYSERERRASSRAGSNNVEKLYHSIEENREERK
jgi:hypothetical protein